MNTFRINSNPASALAYRNLSKSQFNLQTTLERLSSGLRINKAADDSAGSAISTRISNQIRGMKQANENAQQTNNLIQTAESGLSDISGMLSRMRELAVQASTDTLNNTDRASIDLEYQALKNEITRIANVTQYNEMDILNGTDYRNQVNADNSTADDVAGVGINNLSNDIRKGIYILSDEVISVSGQANISNLPNTNVRYDASVQSGSYTLSAVETRVSTDSALQFDGINKYIDLGEPSSLKSENFTLATWFKRLGPGATADTGSGGILAEPLVTKGRGESDGNNKDMNYFLGIRQSDLVLAADFEDFSNGSNHPVTGITVINDDTWYHAAATYDGSEWKLYLNGILEANLTVGKVPRYDSIQDNAVGTALTSGGIPQGYFNGTIDEVAILGGST